MSNEERRSYPIIQVAFFIAPGIRLHQYIYPMKFLTILVALFYGTAGYVQVLYAGQNNLIQQTAQTSTKEDRISNAIFAIPEVAAFSKAIETRSKGTSHLFMQGIEEPIDTDPNCYWIRVGEDNGEMLLTHFHFILYYDTMKIMYYDIAENKELTLEEWR